MGRRTQGRQNVFESGGAKVVKIFLPLKGLAACRRHWMESLLITAGGLGGVDSPPAGPGQSPSRGPGGGAPGSSWDYTIYEALNGLGSCISYANLVEIKTVKNSKFAPFGRGVVARIFLRKTAQMNKKHSKFSNYFSKFFKYQSSSTLARNPLNKLKNIFPEESKQNTS